MTCKVCDYHNDFAEDSILQECDTSSSAGFWQPRCALICVCVCKKEKQLVAYILLVDNTAISAVKMSLQDGKMWVKIRGKSEITDDVHKFMKLERWLSQFLLQKCRIVMEAIYASRSILCRIVIEVWKVAFPTSRKLRPKMCNKAS